MAAIDPREVLDAPVRRYLGLSPETPVAELSEPVATWYEYAVGTVDRGRGVIAQLASRGWPPGARFLDVGCAYGGYLAAAVEAGAARVVGLELSPSLAAIARALAEALELPAQVVEGSVSDQALLSRLGQFDVITCADVIEHVDEPARVLASLAGALAPGGLLYVAVPNFRHPGSVRHDPHFFHFGITLLPRGQAEAYASAAHGQPGYDVGEYHTLSWYRHVLADAGLEVLLLNPELAPESAVALCAQAAELRAQAATFSHPALPAELVAATRRAVDEWAGTLLDELGPPPSRSWWQRLLGRQAPTSPRGDLQEYAVATWNLLARRPVGSAEGA